MEFAGIISGARLRARAPMSTCRSVIAEAVDGVDARRARARRHDRRRRRMARCRRSSGDADALRSAVQNIVGNAVKYSPRGATVDVSAASLNGSRACRSASPIAVSGIDADDLPHIFKPFYRGRRAVDAQVRGTGVGLSVVRHVVDAHRRRDRGRQPRRRGHDGDRATPGGRAAHASRTPSMSTTRACSWSKTKPGLRLTLSDRLGSEGYGVETAERRRDRPRAGGERRLRPHRPRRDAAADERLRRLPRGAAARRDDADPDADGARPGGRQGGRPEARRRRLPHQAVRDDRADGAARGAAAPRDRRARSPAATPIASATSSSTSGAPRSRAAAQPVDLSAREFKLLRHFIEHRGATLSRDAAAGRGVGLRRDAAHAHRRRPRRRPAAEDRTTPKSPEFIVTVHGLGYKFVG